MDKRILTQAELLVLQQFITSRSARFAEPSILLEITDHFASKTEEIWTTEPSLSFDMAMKKAHHAFGVKGFAPIAETYEKSILLKYKTWSRRHAVRLLFSLHTIGMLLAGLLAATGFLFLHRQQWLPLGGFEIMLLVQLTYGIMVHPQRISYKKNSTFRFFHAKAVEASYMMIGWLWAGVIIIPVFSYCSTHTIAVITGILTFTVAFNLVLFHDLMQQVKADTLTLEQQLQLAGS